MNRMDKQEMLDKMLQNMSEKMLLEELINALSTDELYENFEFIARMWDIPFDEDEEDDEDDNN